MEINELTYTTLPFEILSQALTEIKKREEEWPAGSIVPVGEYSLYFFTEEGGQFAILCHGTHKVMSFRRLYANHQA